MEKRYQVFVSSTYADLKEERQHVSQALMEMDCIPAGMEMFPATDEEQWEFIKRIINDCDYYLLIIGGRYGSTTGEGISYTEKEYDYAVEKGIKVIALLHEKPDEISVAKSDITPELREKLQEFREKVSTNRLVKFWSEAKELPGLVALSLSKTIKMFPATGWVRASIVLDKEPHGELDGLRKENRALKMEIFKAKLDEWIVLSGTFYKDHVKHNLASRKTWREIFSTISPYLMQTPNQEYVKGILHKEISEKSNLNKQSYEMNDQVFQTIAVQLRSLDLINIKQAKTSEGNMDTFWSLTPEGEKLMVELRTITSSKK